MRNQHNELEPHSLMISANVIILELMVIGNTVGRMSSGKGYVAVKGVLWVLCSFEVHDASSNESNEITLLYFHHVTYFYSSLKVETNS